MLHHRHRWQLLTVINLVQMFTNKFKRRRKYLCYRNAILT